MRRLVREQALAFVATVRPDGNPAVSPKGTISVFDGGHLVFLHLHSPHTISNLRANPHVEINVVDPIVRKGYRFTGVGTVLEAGDQYDQILDHLAGERGTDYRGPAHAAVLISVTAVEPLISPAYDTCASEDEISAQWRRRHLVP
ncbi:MAG: pyridoxamine 5'-phosphate oxidase family protein [Acidimicrobiales bacterium]